MGSLFYIYPKIECVRCVVVECLPRIYNLFETHSRNVRNVFILCMLHIRKTKVWFLACKNPLFGVQKYGFYIAKVWFLFFECYVVANW